MNRALLITVSLIFILVGLGMFFEAKAAEAGYKAGDQVYACACGEACPCDTLAKAPGKCTCGRDLVNATITKVDKDTVTVKFADGHEEPFKLKK
jgi:hypothetical protein